MSEKVDFNGDVGQAVMGDVKEAPRLNNVVTLHMGSEATPVAAITDLQRASISEVVKDLAALTGDHALDIYRVIFTEFGIEKIRELPRDRYKEVVALVNKWIDDAKDAALPKPAISPPIMAESKSSHCARCEEKDANFKRSQRTIYFLVGALALCLAWCGWMLYKWPNDELKQDAQATCLYEGKPYSAGSVIKTVIGGTRECVSDVAGRSMNWVKIR
jgi:hypothetical protein